MNSAFWIVLLYFIISEVAALRCYQCNSYTHGSACYDPIYNNVNALDCKYTASYRSSIENVNNDTSLQQVETGVIHPRYIQEQQPYGDYDSRASYPNGDFECVQFETVDNRLNKRDYVRRCQKRNPRRNFCTELQQTLPFQQVTLTKCDICTTDYCNSSRNIKLSLFFNAIFFLIFYYSTES